MASNQIKKTSTVMIRIIWGGGGGGGGRGGRGGGEGEGGAQAPPGPLLGPPLHANGVSDETEDTVLKLIGYISLDISYLF